MSILTQKGPDQDVVLSSRVRLARNLHQMPFPACMTEPQSEEIVNHTMNALKGSENAIRYLPMRMMDPQERMLLVESHLISTDLAAQNRGAVLINQDESMCIMVNEEDHLRIQSILPGLQLQRVAEQALETDRLIEQSVPMAYHPKWGYLTCCPTNVGTGMRASVMMHLPALGMTGVMRGTIEAISKVGLTVRGLYGEGSESIGNIYQISNQITLGLTEDEIVQVVESVAKQVMDQERQARSALVSQRRLELEDKLYRSYGILSNARKLDSREFMTLLSDVRLAVDLGWITGMDSQRLMMLMLIGQPAGLQKHAGRTLEPEERDVIRANCVRSMLKANE